MTFSDETITDKKGDNWGKIKGKAMNDGFENDEWFEKLEEPYKKIVKGLVVA